MEQSIDSSRRAFLKCSLASGGALLVGFHLPLLGRRGDALAESDEYAPNARIRIAPDDTVTLRVASSEMGQGVMTAIPMLLAEELEADWAKVRVETAPADPRYKNPLIGQQLTGGSTAVRGYITPLRQAGATVRELMIAAAAQTWAVDETACRAEQGAVVHPASGRRLRYGQLMQKAATLAPPKAVFLKEPSEFRLIGKPTRRLDTPAKVNGSAVFGQDVRLPDMRVALVARCPVFGGRLKRFDAARARSVPGVRDVIAIDSGVAVVADDFWSARQGREALTVEWDEGQNAKLSSEAIRQRLQTAARSGATARTVGDAARALRGAKRHIEATYQVPYLAHATMEPMNCTAYVRADGCDVWVGTQAQTRTQETAAKIAGLNPEQVRVHTLFLGGGFGRRAEDDFVREAVELSKRVGVPVKVMWTREDDVQHDFYRPATYNVLTGPNIHVSYAQVDLPVPVGFWRSVGSSQNAYVTECFLDELAAAAGRDPYAYRRALLKEHPRHLAALELAAAKAGWERPVAAGRHRGIAVAETFGSFAAEVAEISIVEQQLRVHRVVCAIDCGLVVNPDTVAAQMESGIVYGLTAALKGEITIGGGRVQQNNFNDYALLRIDEMPAVEVYIVPSREPPGGVGEPGTPPIAPAVANAVRAATKRPVRSLPIRL